MDRLLVQRVLALAAVQHGLVTTRQAAELGFTADMLRTAVMRGWLRPVRRGVYAVAGIPASDCQPIMAAVLAAGPKAAASHRSAAVIHGFDGIIAETPELVVPHGCRHQLPGVRVHRSRDLAPVDITVRYGIPVTAPIRTVVDLAPIIGDYLLGRILDEGAISRLWTAEQVQARSEGLATPGRTGINRLRSLLALRLGEGHPRSALEQHVWRVLRPVVPEFKVNYAVTIEGQRVEMDLCWLVQQIDGEVDGLAVHGSRTKFEHETRQREPAEQERLAPRALHRPDGRSGAARTDRPAFQTAG